MLRRSFIVRLTPLAAASLSLFLAFRPAAGEDAAASAEAKPDAPAEAKKDAAAKEAPAAAGKPATDAAKGSAAAAPAAPAQAPRQDQISVKAEPFPEKTSVHGEIKPDIQGVWLLITRAEVVQGKFRNFPQLLKVTKGKEGLSFQLLDVKLPPDVLANYQEADRSLAAWTPSDEMRAELSKGLAKLPKVTEKTVNDPPRGKVDYLIAAPDRYDEAFGKLNPVVDTALKESVFAMQIVETYKPIKEVTDSRISQLMQRKVIYGAKSANDGVIQGSSFVGYLASGAGTPLPLQFTGQFVMYRLAKAS